MGKMTATATIEQPAPLRAQLHCSGCGVTIDAACNCGKPYISAGEAAAKAIEADPQKSNNSIAKEIGVSEPTVRRIRGSLKDEPVPSNGGPAKRKGTDGKSYPATKTKKPPERRQAKKSERKRKGSILPEEAYMARVDAAKTAATVPYTGKVTDHIIAKARGVAKVWNELADEFEERHKTLN
jgi:hypothetical protein